MEEVWHWAGLQRTGPAGSHCHHTDRAEDRHELLTADTSNEEKSVLQSCTVLQAAGLHGDGL